MISITGYLTLRHLLLTNSTLHRLLRQLIQLRQQFVRVPPLIPIVVAQKQVLRDAYLFIICDISSTSFRLLLQVSEKFLALFEVPRTKGIEGLA